MQRARARMLWSASALCKPSERRKRGGGLLAEAVPRLLQLRSAKNEPLPANFSRHILDLVHFRGTESW